MALRERHYEQLRRQMISVWTPGEIGTTILKQVGKFNEARSEDSTSCPQEVLTL